MRTKIRFLLLCIFFIGSSTYLNAQKNGEPDILPMPTRTLNCSEVLRYVDDAVIRTDIAETQLLVIVRARHFREARLVGSRVKYIRTYFAAHRTTPFEVLGDISSDRSNVVDLYVDGKVLYSLPIKKSESLAWTQC